MVAGHQITAFSNSEEAAVGLTEIVPFAVESMLRDSGGNYSKADDWQAHVFVSANLITGQNPASSEATAKALLDKLR